MKSSLMTKLVGFVAALSLASVAFAGGLAVSRQINSDLVSQRLSTIHDDAYEVREGADHLRFYNHAAYLSGWEIDRYNLENMRDDINQMGETLYRLRSEEGVLPRNEDREINRIAPPMMELTDTTQAAIVFLNSHHDALWMPQYRAYLSEMYTEANRIERFTRKAGAGITSNFTT